MTSASNGSAALAADPRLADVWSENARLVWGLAYRMTGSAADADDILQETFLRALASPPARTDEPWRPWLVRVAVNLGRDFLRRRRRRGYVGPWLPEPIESEPGSLPALEIELAGGETTEGRYDLVESCSYAFLVALEALSPLQRAVLLLREVFDYGVAETASALDVSEPSVKTTHHRARKALAKSVPPGASVLRPGAETSGVLARFLDALGRRDAEAVQSLLAEGIRFTSDGAGRYRAARKTIFGRDRVKRFLLGVLGKSPAPSRFGLVTLNGAPAVLCEVDTDDPLVAPRFVWRIDLDREGRIAAMHSLSAPAKLGRVPVLGA